MMIKSNIDMKKATDEIDALTEDSKLRLLFVTHPSPSLARTAEGSGADVAASGIGDGPEVGEGQTRPDVAASSAGERQAGGGSRRGRRGHRRGE